MYKGIVLKKPLMNPFQKEFPSDISSLLLIRDPCAPVETKLVTHPLVAKSSTVSATRPSTLAVCSQCVRKRERKKK